MDNQIDAKVVLGPKSIRRKEGVSVYVINGRVVRIMRIVECISKQIFPI